MTSRAKPIFDSLLSIEVDLVVVDSLTSTGAVADHAAPDSVAQALAETYRTYLDDHVPELDAGWRAWVASGEPAALAERAPGRLGILAPGGVVLDRFRPDTSGDALQRAGRDAAVGEAMARALVAAGRLPDTGVANVLRRIHGTVDQLPSAEPAQRVTIARKALELGTEAIKAQTVVQIDGDVIQRMDATMLGATGAARPPRQRRRRGGRPMAGAVRARRAARGRLGRAGALGAHRPSRSAALVRRRAARSSR